LENSIEQYGHILLSQAVGEVRCFNAARDNGAQIELLCKI